MSATFVEPAGVGRASELALGPTERPQHGAVSAPVSPGSYLITAPKHQSFSVDATVPSHLEQTDDTNAVPAALTAVRERREPNAVAGSVTDTIRISGTVAIPSQAPAGHYYGRYRLTVVYE